MGQCGEDRGAPEGAAGQGQGGRERDKTLTGRSGIALSHATWNLGVSALTDCRRGPGNANYLRSNSWSYSKEDNWAVHSYREPSCWRGNGKGFRASDWTLVAKKTAGLGIWCKLKSSHTGSCLWIGCAHLTQGSTAEKHATEVHEFVLGMPTERLPLVVGIDANTPLTWTRRGQELEAAGKEGKGEYMAGKFMEQDVTFTPPPLPQRGLPTCRPRNQEAQGRHIDLLSVKHALAQGKGILVDSHKHVNSDHDVVYQTLHIQGKSKGRQRRPNSCPKRVSGNVTIPEVLNQPALCELASTCTRPYKGVRYQDPEHVKVCFQVARRTRSTEAWKRALRERDIARKQWKEDRIVAATSGDWQAYRETSKKGCPGWEDHMACELQEQGSDPHLLVHDHFRKIYTGQPVPPFPFRQVAVSQDFTIMELRQAIAKGKNGKATGDDGVSHELLVAINREPQGEQKFLAWFNRILHGIEPMPKDWAKTIMIVLPKCSRPDKVKQLRAICLGSAANKIFARMLLERAKPALHYSGPFQNLGAGRQTVDYVWVVSRMMALDHEWKCGLYFVKLDIEKAFDSLHRGKFLSRLSSKMGPCEELRCWWELFRNTEADLHTPWGSSTIRMTSGIRQGSVESPQVFATVMDWVMADAQAKCDWDPSRDVMEGMDFAESAFMDDCLLWGRDKVELQNRVQGLMKELQLWGLRVNPDKSQAYYSPHVRYRGPLRVGNMEVAPSEQLDVMGAPFKSGISPKDALQGILARTRNKFWALKHLFRAKSPLGGRLRLMQKVLAGTALWCAGAFVPDRVALHAVNTLQAQLTIWCMRLHKARDEPWKDFRMRCFRCARYAIFTHVQYRWSTLWLQRAWSYSGHRARCHNWELRPACARLDRFRTLNWWRDQQGRIQGTRHPGRFFPRLMNQERALEAAAGGEGCGGR